MKSARPLALGAAVTSLMLVAACGESSGGDAETLDLWLPPQANIANASDWDPILAGFEEEHGVDVTVRLIPWDNYEEAYLTGITGGEGPDVGLMYSSMMADYLAQEVLVPFDDYLPQSNPPDYLYLDEGRVDGQQVAVPLVVGGARVLYYNADLLAAAGIDEPPSTWDEFLDDAGALADAGITPLVQPWGGHPGMLNENFFPLLWQAGGELFSDDGATTAFNSPEGAAAAGFLREMMDAGILSESTLSMNPDDAEAQFLAGESAFIFSSDARYDSFDDAGFELGLVASLENETRATFVAADALVMLEKCPDKQLCTDLVTYITSPEQMVQFHELAPYPPLSTDEEYTAPEIFRDIYEEEGLLRGLPIVPGSVGVYNALHANLQQMLLGQKTPEQALADAATEGDRALATAQR